LTRHRCRAAWALTALLVATAPGAEAQYRTVETDSLRIIIDSEWARQTAPGYLPVRIDLTNSGDARVIDIVARSQRFSHSRRGWVESGIDARRSVRLEKGDRVQLTMPLPIAADNESIQYEFREGSRRLETVHFGSLESGRSLADAGILIVADAGGAFGKSATGWGRPVKMAGMFTPPAGTTLPTMDVVLPPARVPADWLGFTSVRAVLTGPKDWEQLNDAQKDALLAWTASGGDLIVVDGTLAALFPEGRALPAATANGGAAPYVVAPYFFGHIHMPTLAAVESAGLAATLTTVELAAKDADRALPANRASDWARILDRGFQLPIPGVERVPARAYLVILIAFTVLIGPVNYWFLWRRRQQVLLVLTTPLISAVFVVLLAGYVVFAEGFGVRGRVVSFTLLDQATKQAATRATASLYAAGMTPAGGLLFPRDVAVYRIGADGKMAPSRQTLDLTESQRYPSGALEARSPTNLEVIGFRPARERLSFSRDGEGLAVSNGLGATVVQLFYRDGDTAYASSAPLATGARTTLQRRPFTGAQMSTSDPAIPSKLLRLFDTQPIGSYLAVVERSPFVELGMSGIEERSSYHLVMGVAEARP
jgi:hypothetical protein